MEKTREDRRRVRAHPLDRKRVDARPHAEAQREGKSWYAPPATRANGKAGGARLAGRYETEASAAISPCNAPAPPPAVAVKALSPASKPAGRTALAAVAENIELSSEAAKSSRKRVEKTSSPPAASLISRLSTTELASL